jgi:protein CpxP
MNLPSAHRAAGVLTAATLVSILALGYGAPASAADAAKSPMQLVSTPAHAEHATVDDVEDRIENLHKKLNITEAQTAPWNDFAQVMRDNGKTIRTIIASRTQTPKTMSAVDDLHSYQVLAQAHVDGLNKLVPSFETLYAAMSDDQKRNADAVFSESRHHAAQ